ncbi:MAG: AAA family ATPase [Candidatus Aureabacteria bacterium]|nr:AAA family ATPase [Candidatus Auribacterota bacterium]
MKPFQRAIVEDLERGIRSDHRLLQVVIGPRQVGKTTAVQQLLNRLKRPHHVASADTALPPGAEWIESHWNAARVLPAKAGAPAILVLDEIQKVRGWSEVVKRLWDEARRARRPLRVILLGSSSLLLQRGLVESLAGRFMLYRCAHWSWTECRRAFGWDLDRWLYFGGYPGAAPFADDEPLWKRYVADSLVEPAIARDVLQLQTVHKPSLLRHLFAFAAAFPAQYVSYNKMLGQLQDAGNTTTLAHYLKLLETAFLVSGLELYSVGRGRRRGSSPKLILWNSALIHALSLLSFARARREGAWWGRVVENAVGAHLLNHLPEPVWQVTYWREGNQEVDFVVTQGREVWALEVKSGRPGRLSGLAAFRARYPRSRALLIGSDGIPIEDFFARSPAEFFSRR